MRFAITGGCGFLGSNIASRLLREASGELFVLDNLSRHGGTENLAWLRQQGTFTFQPGDVRVRGDVDRFIERAKPDVVFHLAGQVAMTTSIENPRADFETNVCGTFHLLEAVRAFSPQAAIVYSSTNKVYGDLLGVRWEKRATRYVLPDYPEGLPESVPLDFRTPYGTSKGAADQYVLEYSRTFGLRTTVFRHSSMYGGRQFATADQGWIGWFCGQALAQAADRNAPSFTISGTGLQVRDLLHADDMVDLYLRAAAQIDRLRGTPFNVGGGMANSLSLLELFALLESELDVTLRYERLPERHSDQKVFVADTRALRELLGWEPKVDKVTGVRRMLAWLREQMS